MIFQSISSANDDHISKVNTVPINSLRLTSLTILVKLEGKRQIIKYKAFLGTYGLSKTIFQNKYRDFFISPFR